MGNGNATCTNEVKEIHNPITGCLSKLIACKASHSIIVPKSKIVPIIVTTYQETKGTCNGARKLKLHVHTSHYYSDLSRNVSKKC